MRVAMVVVVFVCSFFACVRFARADTLEAPVGGKSIPIGEGRVACAAGAGWVIDPGGKAVRPPINVTAVGSSIEAKVAATLADCGKSNVTVKLVATGSWPAFDTSQTTLALDEGRLDMHGRNLRGVIVTWPAPPTANQSTNAPPGLASDTCRDPKTDSVAGTDGCSWGVPKTTSADPTTSPLRWFPAGSTVGSDVVVFDSDGKRASSSSFAIVPSRVEISQLVPADASVDVASGVGLLPIAHHEAVAGVECGGVRCTIENGALGVQAPPASISTLDIKFRLIAHVFFTRKNPPDPQPILRVSILRCPMSVVSGRVLRSTDSARAVVRVEGACARDVGVLKFLVGPRRVDVVQTETIGNYSYAVLAVGNVDAPTLSFTAARGEIDATVVAVARIETIAPPKVRTVLEIAPYPPIDFIPTNRRAVVHVTRLQNATLALIPVENVYDVKTENGADSVQGDLNAAGFVALQFGYRNPTLPAPLDKVDLAILSDPLQRGVKVANVPAPFATTANSNEPLVEVGCLDEKRNFHRVTPGLVEHIPYGTRDSCRVILHTERLSPEFGSQKVSLEIEVDKLDGSSRGEAHVTQPMILRHSREPRVAWIKGIGAPYDKVIVRFSMVADEQHYLGAQDLVTAAPTLQWAMILGTGHLRLYATSAIPTGLYRFGDAATSGALTLSFGVLSRLTWLDSTGHEGLLGLEAGVMVFGLTNNDTSATGQSLTQVGAVIGIGLSIPLANAGGIAQASFNLHLWFEQRITGTNDPASSSQALIFGPSISFGNLGASF